MKIGRMAKSVEDINFIVDTLRRYDYLHNNKQYFIDVQNAYNK